MEQEPCLVLEQLDKGPKSNCSSVTFADDTKSENNIISVTKKELEYILNSKQSSEASAKSCELTKEDGEKSFTNDNSEASFPSERGDETVISVTIKSGVHPKIQRYTLENLAEVEEVGPADFCCLKEGYRLGKEIGEGTYSCVRAAEVLQEKIPSDSKVARLVLKNKHRWVAVKILNKNKAPADYTTKFIGREIQALHRIRGHQNVVEIYDVFETNDYLFIITELCQKGDLFHYINASADAGRTGLSEDQARSFFVQICNGMQYCHQRGVVHRDFKCENVLISDDEKVVKITDFGFACTVPNKRLMLFTPCGSYSYAAPEVLFGKAYNPFMSDVWSLGVVLFCMLNGTTPYGHVQLSLLEEYMGSQRLQFQKISLEAKHLLRQLLTYEPRKRPKIPDILKSPWITKQNTHFVEKLCTPVLEDRSHLVDIVSKLNVPTSPNFSTEHRQCINFSRISFSNGSESVCLKSRQPYRERERHMHLIPILRRTRMSVVQFKERMGLKINQSRPMVQILKNIISGTNTAGVNGEVTNDSHKPIPDLPANMSTQQGDNNQPMVEYLAEMWMDVDRTVVSTQESLENQLPPQPLNQPLNQPLAQPLTQPVRTVSTVEQRVKDIADKLPPLTTQELEAHVKSVPKEVEKEIVANNDNDDTLNQQQPLLVTDQQQEQQTNKEEEEEEEEVEEVDEEEVEDEEEEEEEVEEEVDEEEVEDEEEEEEDEEEEEVVEEEEEDEEEEEVVEEEEEVEVEEVVDVTEEMNQKEDEESSFCTCTYPDTASTYTVHVPQQDEPPLESPPLTPNTRWPGLPLDKYGYPRGESRVATTTPVDQEWSRSPTPANRLSRLHKYNEMDRYSLTIAERAKLLNKKAERVLSRSRHGVPCRNTSPVSKHVQKFNIEKVAMKVQSFTLRKPLTNINKTKPNLGANNCKVFPPKSSTNKMFGTHLKVNAYQRTERSSMSRAVEKRRLKVYHDTHDALVNHGSNDQQEAYCHQTYRGSSMEEKEYCIDADGQDQLVEGMLQEGGLKDCEASGIETIQQNGQPSKAAVVSSKSNECQSAPNKRSCDQDADVKADLKVSYSQSKLETRPPSAELAQQVSGDSIPINGSDSDEELRKLALADHNEEQSPTKSPENLQPNVTHSLKFETASLSQALNERLNFLGQTKPYLGGCSLVPQSSDDPIYERHARIPARDRPGSRSVTLDIKKTKKIKRLPPEPEYRNSESLIYGGGRRYLHKGANIRASQIKSEVKKLIKGGSSLTEKENNSLPVLQINKSMMNKIDRSSIKKVFPRAPESPTKSMLRKTKSPFPNPLTNPNLWQVSLDTVQIRDKVRSTPNIACPLLPQKNNYVSDPCKRPYRVRLSETATQSTYQQHKMDKSLFPPVTNLVFEDNN